MSKTKIKLDLNTEVKTTSITSNQKNDNRLPLLFQSINYKLMFLGLIIILLGYGLMMGTNNDGSFKEFPSDDIYSFRRIILAPIIILSGFAIELFAILKARK